MANDANSDARVDEGTAYGRRPQQANKLLTEVGPGTPCGELMRRYWQPIAASQNRSPICRRRCAFSARISILFRDGQGRPGLLYPRCMHRGTASLLRPRRGATASAAAITGGCSMSKARCLEQPCEPDGGRHRDAACASPGIPSKSATASCSPISGRPTKKPVLPALRQPRDARAPTRTTGRTCRRLRLDRRCEPERRAVQLAAHERQRDGPVSRARAALDA